MIVVGNKEDFLKYFDGHFKNKVNYISRVDRKNCGGICEYCGGAEELQSAHKHGFEREKIITDLLQEYEDNQGQIRVDIKEFEKKFIEKHMPNREHFYFLCQKCHSSYDHNKIEDKEIRDKIMLKYQQVLDMLKGKKK